MPEDGNNNHLAEEDSDSESDARSTASSATYDGVEQLFAGEEALERRVHAERTLREAAQKIQNFKVRVLDMFERQKNSIQARITSALDLQVTLEELIVSQQEALRSEDEERQRFIKTLLDDIRASEDFVGARGIGSMSRDLDDIVADVGVLRSLTTVKDEDEVLCTVCLSCPLGVIWDCVRCDHLVCDACRQRVSACPTCRVRFGARGKAPRRNRWAEKLARMQWERSGLDQQMEF